MLQAYPMTDQQIRDAMVQMLGKPWAQVRSNAAAINLPMEHVYAVMGMDSAAIAATFAPGAIVSAHLNSSSGLSGLLQNKLVWGLGLFAAWKLLR